MREGHLGRGTDYIGSETNRMLTYHSQFGTFIVENMTQRSVFFMSIKKQRGGMILHQRHSNKVSLNICISTSQGTWLSNIFTSRGVNFTSFPLGDAVNANPDPGQAGDFLHVFFYQVVYPVTSASVKYTPALLALLFTLAIGVIISQT